MNQRLYNKIVLMFANACLAGLSGCGAPREGLILQPKLPDSLKSQARWAQMKGAASHWELTVKPKPEGTEARWTFAPTTSRFPIVRFPESPGGRWEVTLKLRDRGEAGALRSAAMLSGKKVVTAQDVRTATTLELPLSIHSGVELP